MILSIPEPSMTFFMSHNGVTVTVTSITYLSHFVTCMTITYDVMPLLLPKSKIK